MALPFMTMPHLGEGFILSHDNVRCPLTQGVVNVLQEICMEVQTQNAARRRDREHPSDSSTAKRDKPSRVRTEVDTEGAPAETLVHVAKGLSARQQHGATHVQNIFW